MAKRKKRGMATKPATAPWIKVVIGIILLFGIITFTMFAAVFLAIFSGEIEPSGDIAHIKIAGPIVSEKTALFGTKMAASPEIVKLLKKAKKNDNIKAVIVEVNSPGGSAVASAEIASAMEMEKPVIAVIREAGASGGYWIASAADHIILLLMMMNYR